MRRVAAVLLAAGASSRMGRPKALLPFPPGGRGEPLVRRVARALTDGGASPVVVVIRPDAIGGAIAAAAGGQIGVEIVANPTPEQGMLSSVQIGVRRVLDFREKPMPAAFLVCPCDLPRLTADHVARVVGAWDGDEETIIVPAFEGKRGHPTLFGAALITEVLALTPEKYGLNEVLRRRAGRVREVGLSDDAILRDVDTPRDWQALGGTLSEDRRALCSSSFEEKESHG